MTDDMTELLTAMAQTATGQPIGFRAGVIVSFNQATFENVVQVDGENLTNLKVLTVFDAAHVRAGRRGGDRSRRRRRGLCRTPSWAGSSTRAAQP